MVLLLRLVLRLDIEMGIDILALWSVVAFVLRVMAILVFMHLCIKQYREFKNQDGLEPLKKLVFYIVALLIASNIPVMFLHWQRIFGRTGGIVMTSIATVTNAGCMLVIAVLLYMVYRYTGTE